MKKISIIMSYNHKLSPDPGAYRETFESLIRQNYHNWELLIINETGEKVAFPLDRHDNRVKFLSGDFANHAQAFNRAVQAATGEYLLLVNDVQSLPIFRLSTLDSLVLTAKRHDRLGLIYSDYSLINTDGTQQDIHLLDYHAGRLRDNMDLGVLWFCPRSAFHNAGGLDERYNAAHFYDLRLKLAEQFKIVHVAAARNGYLYLIRAAAKSHNVFDYLLSGREMQLEMEDALTQHLKRIGAYLPPGTNYHRVQYTAEENRQFEQCIASVVIPVFNRKEFIGNAIESVQAQTVSNVEVIVVVNGGPDDPTIDGVKPYLPGGDKYDPDKPPVTLVVEDINNIGYCLNRGIQQARGKYYVQLDSDDRLKSNAVEKLVEVFDSDEHIGMVIGSYEVWKKDEATGEISRMEDIPVVTHDEWTEENGRNNLLRVNGAGAPRAAHIKVIKELGWFGMNDSDHCRNYGEDYDLVLRVSERYRIGRVWEPIYEVIRHAGGTDHAIDQLTIDRNDNAKDHIRLEAIRRRQQINRQSS